MKRWISKRNLRLGGLFSCVATIAGLAPLNGEELAAPPAFQTNCQACHELDRALVGPSLVEISELYTEQSRADFIQWCLEPGRKREFMPQMPSMVHIPEKELSEIFDYIKKVSVGVKRVRTPSADPLAAHPSMVRRPRVERTFLPQTGPASVLIALPTSKKLNVVWDTDKCRLRYISQGETDRWPYLRSNGNALAKVGDIVYEEAQPLFGNEAVFFKGYEMDRNGYPVFIYEVGKTTVREAIYTEGDAVVRRFRASPRLPEYVLRNSDQGEMETKSELEGETLTITHNPKKK
ncbi:c-type cytochrome [Pelagicoccus sp. SDUM812005]|uniref:c-type cytochrome n=1 Tax=Pelagicoccus sp. SDUM812005 TaxID=3041257 RepID=UPI00280C492F|nr:c-type cytochrome [Pelagicoccus sp. SDUM812005]MDQ8183299.1 hypothetical protein [Pelagicoccus sp. SDUM812005]